MLVPHGILQWQGECIVVVIVRIKIVISIIHVINHTITIKYSIVVIHTFHILFTPRISFIILTMNPAAFTEPRATGRPVLHLRWLRADDMTRHDIPEDTLTKCYVYRT